MFFRLDKVLEKTHKFRGFQMQYSLETQRRLQGIKEWYTYKYKYESFNYKKYQQNKSTNIKKKTINYDSYNSQTLIEKQLLVIFFYIYKFILISLF